ncbi:MAG: Single-stranded-DNA-specific exonuclease RecJ [Deltaproteobacteria bacterium]|nr:Single-stranded-DNA-specific exonuclease RecJ [Deltaproteobacteria bacterium]
MRKIWKLKPPSPHAPALSESSGLSLLEAQILIHRGILDPRDVDAYLLPRLADLLDPYLLKDMQASIDLIVSAMDRHEPITIYGDYDADGLTATALLSNLLSSLDVPVHAYIPNRLTEGYGLHVQALERIARRGPGLIVTVDCGVSNNQEITFAAGLGLKVVVTDHHQVDESFTPLCPVVNPHRPDCSFPFKHLTGVGLAFYLAVALRAGLRERGWFADRPEPDLKNYLDLVALGTVADMAPLLDQNRLLVKTGLDRIRTTHWPGLAATAEQAGLSLATLTAQDLAFRIAPRFNASGRLGDAEIALRALTTRDPRHAKEVALQLDRMNGERQRLEREVLDEIEATLPSMAEFASQRALVVTGAGWHRGILGIVASKLLEKYRRPVLVLGVEDGTAVGSGRSIAGFNLYNALSKLEPLLERFGGHRHAAGLALKVSNLERLRQEFETLARAELSEQDLVHTIEVDAEVHLKDMAVESIRRLNTFSPFGHANPEPLFYSGACDVVESKVVGERHLKMKVRQNGAAFETIGFGLAEDCSTPRGQINFIFTPEIDRWQGQEKARLRMIDLEPSDQPSKLQRPAASL